ncbi:SDR family NAD(P)-dependent oxidoreductase [Marinitenerispora sediminis]|uniref:Oxidoreductase n=1 Tax=Marinitenerispora sediminis TaxID=1931232 RepID=A0A368T3G8_9ACTN|nr:SDR family NAD(P)-dependent oxidoreductase [Marinitenerispora sediminis]RCV51448.1 oxidoreductase [Marinitenerispora sediminis]RCV51906.1 oxidoreductase [Marinitenerispora sediminis]RCV55245.1 oxidoreductase [Marinitenerispora sediminis]
MASSKTFVITGGTDGIGAAVARALLRRGDHVAVVGTDPAKGAGLLREAAGSAGSASFLPADLSLVSENRRVARELAAAHPVIDGLVLCARFYQAHRRVTPEGFEHNFALFYLSRWLLGYGLLGSLERAEAPVVLNVAGPGHATPIDWDDLQTAREYDGGRAMSVTGRYNDLLGVAFARRHGAGPVRYVLFHPGRTSTALAGEYDAPTRLFVEQQKAAAKPATEVVPPILGILDAPPAEPLSAFAMHARIDVRDELFPIEAAARLAAATEELVAPHAE